MGELLNSLTRLYPNMQMVIGRVTYSAGVPSLASLSGDDDGDQDQVTIADTAAGGATISVANFKGPAGVCLGFGNSDTSGINLTTSIGTYSGDTASVAFAGINVGTQVATDANFKFLIVAF